MLFKTPRPGGLNCLVGIDADKNSADNDGSSLVLQLGRNNIKNGLLQHESIIITKWALRFIYKMELVLL